MPASLLSAKIRGLRSYSPYPHKAQTIEFMPLTLIVGSNGSGKTTVIESLKFMISGDEPPLSDSRRNFLHTSKKPANSFDKNMPYACIEIHFMNHKGELCIAKREISLPTGAKTATPSISSSYKVGRKPWTMVHKQDDWNKTVPLMFNLPNQALLNNVVLCHQEENLWCMGDSSTVKQTFDKIFGCEQYKKEIKYIDVEIKTCKNNLAISEKDMAHAKEKVVRLQQLEQDYESVTFQRKQLKSDYNAVKLEIDQVQQKIVDLQKSSKELEDMHQNSIIQKTRLSDAMTLKAEAEKSISGQVLDPQVVTTAEIERKLADHERVKRELATKKDDIYNQTVQTKQMLSSQVRQQVLTQNKVNDMKVMTMKLEEQHSNLIKTLESLKVEHSLKGLDPNNTEDSLDILAGLHANLQEEERLASKAEARLSDMQMRLTSSILETDGHQQKLQNKIHGSRAFIGNLNDQLAQADPISKDLVHVTENLGKMSLITSQLAPSTQVESLVEIIKDSEHTMHRLTIKFNSDTVAKLTSDVTKEDKKITDAQAELESVETRKKQLATEKTRNESDYVRAREASKEAHNKFYVLDMTRKKLIKDCQLYASQLADNGPDKMAAKLRELEQIDQKIVEFQKRVESLVGEERQIVETMSKLTDTHQCYQTNYRLRNIVQKIDDIKQKIASIEKNEHRLNEFPALQLDLKEQLKLDKDLHGRIRELQSNSSHLSQELNRIDQEMMRLKGCNTAYADSIGRFVCNEIIARDLELLKECFQKSIINFHNQMILKINEVLKSRWRQVYKGGDIDHIELVDEEIIRGKDKKSFNYYIAMRKEGIRMKMREKSSAGQKALASIILRMTLAELFVKDFAFIALDEPTANLDLANVQSLARAIAIYVKRRMKRGFNIQWIIISHDENFLRALDAECSPYYYRAQLDEEGCSKIIKLSYQESPLSSMETNSLSTTQRS